jgi:hypothetical protein
MEKAIVPETKMRMTNNAGRPDACLAIAWHAPTAVPQPPRLRFSKLDSVADSSAASSSHLALPPMLGDLSLDTVRTCPKSLPHATSPDRLLMSRP